MRADLLQLTDDDLTALTNRGTVRRARQEQETTTVALSLDDHETLTAVWSDGFECVLEAGAPLTSARCTCPAEPPCRHVVRTIMACAGSAPPAESDAPSVPDTVGSASARRLFEAGQLFELTRSAKPISRCHSLGTVTRILVPGDPNLSICDCGQPAPCDHAWMALWAFERLPEGVVSGLVDSRMTAYSVPRRELDLASSALGELLKVGLSSAPGPLWDRLLREETSLRKAGLIWPAECLSELPAMRDAYHARDARFDGAELARLLGELLLRLETIHADRGVVPPIFVRGAASDRVLEIASAKLIGLGCRGEVRREGVRLIAYLQDEDTGQVVGAAREFKSEGRTFSDLASAALTKGITLHEAASGRTLIRGGRRSPGGFFSFGRAPAARHPQSFQWEKLRAPTLAEGFAEVGAHLAALPPTPLRPRRLGEAFHVVPVKEVAAFGFDAARQAVVARLRDGAGHEATLVHPYHSLGAGGCDALLQSLSAKGSVAFVAGTFQQRGATLFVYPSALVCREGSDRNLVLPWLDEVPPERRETIGRIGDTDAASRTGRFLLEELPQLLGDALLTGLEARTEPDSRRWGSLARQAETLGYTRIPELLDGLAAGNDEAFRTVLKVIAIAPDFT